MRCALPVLGLALLVPSVARAVPTIEIGGPNEVDEGRDVVLFATVRDDEGPVSFSWDLDGDGRYGESPGEAFVAYLADATDGPRVIEVGVEAVGPTATVAETHVLRIRNVAPSFSGEPPTTARVRLPYRYEVTVGDPGAVDVLDVRLTSRPAGMELEGDVVTWEPQPDQRGRSFPVILRASDGDGGEATQSWMVSVAQNAAPGAPRPLSPVDRARVAEGAPVELVFGNAVDPDGDPLRYAVRVSRTFDFADPIELDVVDEDASGRTTVPVEPLERGHWYWEVRSDDGMERSAPVYAQLVVGEAGSPTADAGPRGPPASGGCSVGRGDSPWPLGFFVLLGLLGLARRR